MLRFPDFFFFMLHTILRMNACCSFLIFCFNFRIQCTFKAIALCKLYACMFQKIENKNHFVNFIERFTNRAAHIGDVVKLECIVVGQNKQHVIIISTQNI